MACKRTLILWFFFFLIGSPSCISQETQNLRHVQQEQEPVNEKKWKDPLFFIEGQLCAWVRCMFEDSRGTLWFGTNHYGVMRYQGDSLSFINEKHGIGKGRINGFVEDEQGAVWIATWDGLSKYDPVNQSFANYPVKVGPSDNDLQSIIQDQNGLIWLGTLEGAVTFDGSNFTHFDLPNIAVKDTTSILSYNRVSTILEDSDGILWFGTDGFGICRYDPASKNFSHITIKEGLPDNNVSQLFQDKKGNIWIGTMFGGIASFKPNNDLTVPSFQNYTKDGLTEGIEASSFYEDSKGNIFFSAENVGIYKYNGTQFIQYSKEQGLESLGIISMLEDSKNRFWLGGWGGLFRWNRNAGVNATNQFYPITKDGPWH